jgi:hypothetical protein
VRFAKKNFTLSMVPFLLQLPPSFAGGTQMVGGPGAGIPGVPLFWDNSKPIVYRVDAGPLSRRPNGAPITIDNAPGITRMNSMFANWSAVSTASLTIANAGGLLAIPSAGFPAGGDVQTPQQFLNVGGDPGGQANPDPNSCKLGRPSPEPRRILSGQTVSCESCESGQPLQSNLSP